MAIDAKFETTESDKHAFGLEEARKNYTVVGSDTDQAATMKNLSCHKGDAQGSLNGEEPEIKLGVKPAR